MLFQSLAEIVTLAAAQLIRCPERPICRRTPECPNHFFTWPPPSAGYGNRLYSCGLGWGCRGSMCPMALDGYVSEWLCRFSQRKWLRTLEEKCRTAREGEDSLLRWGWLWLFLEDGRRSLISTLKQEELANLLFRLLHLRKSFADTCGAFVP